jgi:hypothetical protein
MTQVVAPGTSDESSAPSHQTTLHVTLHITAIFMLTPAKPQISRSMTAEIPHFAT